MYDSDGINAIKAVANLRKSLQVGFTALRDLGMNNSQFDAKEALTRGMVRGPRLFIAGKAIMCTGGHTWWCGREADGPGRGRPRCRARAEVQARRSPASIHGKGVRRSSAARKLRTAANEHLLGQRCRRTDACPERCATSLTRWTGSEAGRWWPTTTILATMAERGVMVVPTLSPGVMQTERGPARGMPEHTAVMRRERMTKNPPGAALRKMREGGRCFPPSAPTGSPYIKHNQIMGEMQALLKYGVVNTPLDVIQMLTVNSAKLRGDEKDLGTVETGKLADLVVIGGDPVDSISALGNVRHVFVGGEQLVTDGQLTDWYSW